MSGANQQLEQARTTAQLGQRADLSGMAMVANSGGNFAGQMAAVLDPLANRVQQMATAEGKRQGEAAAAAEPLIRDAEGKLAPPTLEQGMLLTTGENTRREVLAARYGSEFMLGNARAISELRETNRGNPDAFMDQAKAHKEGLLEALPPALRLSVGQGYDQEVQRNFMGLRAEQIKFERESTLTAADDALATLSRDMANANASGPAGAAAAAGIATSVKAILAENVRLQLRTPAQAAIMERSLLVVEPTISRLVGQASRAGVTEGRAMVEALMVGPQSPGWNPAWNELRPSERQAVAREAGQIVSYRWATVQHNRDEGDRAVDTSIASISARIGGLQQRVMDTAAGVASEPVTAQERQGLLDMMVRRTELMVQRRNANAGQSAQAPGQLADAESRTRARTITGEISLESAEKQYGGDPEFTALQDRVRSLRLEDRAAIINRFVSDRDGERRAGAPAANADLALQASLALNGPSVANSALGQAAAGRELARRVTPTSSPAEFMREAVAVAEGGAAPPQMMTMIERGLAGGKPEDIQQAGRMVRALEQSPRAINTLAGIEPRQRNALTRAANSLDAGGPPEVVMQQFRAEMRQQVGPLDTARARLGDTPAKQTEALAELVNQTIADAQRQQTPGLLARFGAAAAFVATGASAQADAARLAFRPEDVFVPEAMRQVVGDRILSVLPGYSDLSTRTLNPFGTSPLDLQLRREAGAVLGTEWGQSSIATMPGSPANRWQWVQGAPESRYAVPDANGRPSVEWVQPFVQRQLTELKVPGMDAARFGVDMSLVPIGRDADGEWRYQVLRREHSSWRSANLPLPGGRGEGLTPATIRLAERATELRRTEFTAAKRREADDFDAREAAAVAEDAAAGRSAVPGSAPVAPRPIRRGGPP